MLMNLIKLTPLIISVLVASCSASNNSSPNESTPENAANESQPVLDLDSLTTSFVGSSPGGVDVLTHRNGVLERSSAGVASGAGEALEPGRLFRVGSISKTFIAVMVLQLVDENVVNLDATLVNYLPNTAVGADVTVRQLLSHTSGVPNYTEQPAFFEDVFADPNRTVSPDEVLSYVVDIPANAAGEFAYSNTNYILLGQLIEQLDGVGLNASLKARITDPLGLENTLFDDGTDNIALPDSLVGAWSNAAGFDGDPTVVYKSIASSAWAAGSLISTTDDLYTFINALVTGQLMSNDSFMQMSNTGENDYGLGLFLISLPSGKSFLGHTGSIPGYVSIMTINPDDGSTLVVLSNNETFDIGLLSQLILNQW